MNNQIMHIQLNEQKWNRRAKIYDLKLFDFFRFMQLKVLKLADIQPNINFLDLGCGTGWAVHQSALLSGYNGQFVGLDISAKMIEKARTKNGISKNINFVRASSDMLPFENNHFDIIICTNSFHHHPFPQKTVSEAGRVLKPGGSLYILDVTSDNFFAKMLNYFFVKTEKEHVRFYNSKEYKRFFENAGLNYYSKRKFAFIFKIHCAKK